ncbi:MAG: UbiD family decarboxylase [Gammaproteobacteria bacterium]|nr:UbiD family decarboxylase [Gammaproteobacteria bacterium]
MTDKTFNRRQRIPFSRREFLAASGAGIAVASGSYAASATTDSSKRNAGPAATAPFDGLRDYLQALEENGLLMRFDRIDQDAYEGTALMYRLVDHYGRFHAPVVLFEEVRIDGRWIKGPVIANHSRHVDIETILFGLQPVPGDAPATFRRARQHLDQLLSESGGAYPTIPPVLIPGENAPCKEVILAGDDIDIRRFPFFRNNPGDSGRFINTASVFTVDPEMGLNIGTYRCEIKGPRHIAVGSGEGQSGYNMLMAAKARGEKSANIALVVGQDPMIWLVSGARIPERRGKKPIDELATAGGLRGKAIEVVTCETSDFQVPAHAEMIIEGVVSLESFELNGPYGEGTGYIGAPYDTAFPMTVTRVTHRKDPWIVNDFTGVTRALLEMPGAALTTAGLKLFIPEISDYRYVDSVTFFSIKKEKPGQALEIGKRLAKMIPVFKIVMMVDDDVDLWNPADLFMAFATRWQAYPASHVFEDLPTMPLEPSSPVRERTSKIVIDATRQLPEEGGPEIYSEYSRQVLTRHDPEIFERIDEKWADAIARGPEV